MPPSTLVDMLKEVHLTGAYSDLDIQCGNYTAKVHKVVVCSQSEWFAKAVCDGRFVEGQTGSVTLHDTTAKAARAMLEFMYTHDYNLPSTVSPSACLQLLDHLDVYALADMIQHTDLRATAKRKFNALLHEDLYSVDSGGRTHMREIEAIPRWPSPPYYVSPRLVRSFVAPVDGGPPASEPVTEQGGGILHLEPLFLRVVIKAFDVAPPHDDGEHLKQMAFDRMRPHVKYVFEEHEDFAMVMKTVPELGQKVWNVLVDKQGLGYKEKEQEEPKTSLRGLPALHAQATNASGPASLLWGSD